MMFHTIEILDDAMCVMDEDGNTFAGATLTGYRKAKKQIQKWTGAFTIDVADTYRKLHEHFSYRESFAEAGKRRV
jgi:hypothetical protein